MQAIAASCQKTERFSSEGMHPFRGISVFTSHMVIIHL